MTKGGAAAVTLASKWQVSFDDSEETDNEVEDKDNLISPEHRPTNAQESPSKVSHVWSPDSPVIAQSNAKSAIKKSSAAAEQRLDTTALRNKIFWRMKKQQKSMRRVTSQPTSLPGDRIAPLIEIEEGDGRRLLHDDIIRSWSCPDLSSGGHSLPGSPVRISASDSNLHEMVRSGSERTHEKRNVPSRRHSAEIQSNIDNLKDSRDSKRWSVGSTYEKITKKLPEKDDGGGMKTEDSHNDGIKSAPIPSSVRPKGILRKSGSDQPLSHSGQRLESERVFSNKLIVTTIEWEANDKVGCVVKHEVESPTLEKQSPATPVTEVTRLHMDEPSVYFDAPQPNEEDSDDPRREEDEYDTPPKDDVHSTSNISETTRYDDALQFRRRSPTPPNRSAAAVKYSSAIRRKLKDVDFHVAEAVIEEDKEGGSASDCVSPRLRHSVTQTTRPHPQPPLSRSGAGHDDMMRSTIPVHTLDTAGREPTPETDSDSWRVAKTGSEESVRPGPYMLKSYNRRRPRSMIEGGNARLNGKYTADFASRASSASKPSPLYTARGGGGMKQRVPLEDGAKGGGVPSSRSASSSREESEYLDSDNKLVHGQKRSDFFIRSISWDAKFRKERSPNSRKSSSEDKYVRAEMNDWRGRHSRRRHRAGLTGGGSGESRIPRPKGRLRNTDSDEQQDFQQERCRPCSGGLSPVSSSLPALQSEAGVRAAVQPDFPRNCKSEVLIPRFKPDAASAYMQPR